MRRLVTFSLAVALLLPISISEAAKNPVAGTQCTKIGISQVYKDKKFTCIKSGKRFVWNRGVSITKANPASTPIPTVTSMPSPSPSPTETSMPSPSPTHLSDYEKIVAEFQSISRDSYNKVRDIWPTSRRNLSIEFHYTENFPKDILAAWKIQAENSVNFYDQLVDTKQTFHIYFVTEKDQKWLEDLGFWNPENYTFFQYWSVGLEKNNCEGAAAWFLTAKGAKEPQLHGGIAISSMAKLNEMTLWCQHVLSHEMFHSVQDYWLTKMQGNRGFESRDAYDLVEMPIFREGSADTVATAIGEPSYEDYFNSFKARFYPLLRRETPILQKIRSRSDLVAYLRNCEIRSKFTEAHEASYLVGMLMFEYAVHEYGFGKYVELLKRQNKDTPFREVFKNVYGFEIDEMYAKSADHIFNGIRVLTGY